MSKASLVFMGLVAIQTAATAAIVNVPAAIYKPL
jgi:hypothetical protein